METTLVNMRRNMAPMGWPERRVMEVGVWERRAGVEGPSAGARCKMEEEVSM